MKPILYRKSTFPAFDQLDTIFNDVFGHKFGKAIGNDVSNNIPAINVRLTDDAYHIELAAPGLRKADFNIKLENDLLTISAKREEKSEETKESKFTRREFNYATFSRSFHLPDDVNTEAVTATYENGILTLTLTKVEKKETIKKIEIA